MAVLIGLVVYLSAAALPRGRSAALGIGVGLAAAALAWMSLPQAGDGPAVLYRLYVILATTGLLMAAFAQALRLILPREGVLARAYPAVVLTVAVLAPMAARAILG